MTNNETRRLLTFSEEKAIQDFIISCDENPNVTMTPKQIGAITHMAYLLYLNMFEK